MANFFNPDHALDRQIKDLSVIPLSMGRFLIASDSRSIFYDLKDSRIQLTDIITLNTEAERRTVVSPFDKFYFVKESFTLWRNVNGVWKSWPSGGASRSENAVLTVTGWVGNTQTVAIDGLTVSQNGIVGLSQSVSVAELEAAGNAGLYVSGQADGSFNISFAGDRPMCDIPIAVILFN